LEFGPLIH